MHHLATAQRAFESGLLTSTVLVLMILHNQQRRGWRLGTIAKVTGMSRTLVNSAKRELIRKEQVTLRYPARDKRAVKMYLTAEGRKKAAQLWQALHHLDMTSELWRHSDPPDA